MNNLHQHVERPNMKPKVWVNSGCRIQDCARRIPAMVSDKADAAVLHLGTNNLLNSRERFPQTV